MQDGTIHTTYSQIGGLGPFSSAVATYSLQGDVLTITQNGQTSEGRIQVIDPDNMKVFGSGGFYTATRTAG